MAEYIDLNNTEVLAEAGENAKLVVEEDGELKRIPAQDIGKAVNWDQLQGKPFYEQELLKVEPSVDANNLGVVWRKVSDNNLANQPENGFNAKAWFGGTYGEINVYALGDIVIYGEFFAVFVKKANAVLDTAALGDDRLGIRATFPEVGMYFMEKPEPMPLLGLAVAGASEPEIAWDGSPVRIIPIADKFLPTTVPVIQTASVGQTVVVKAVDESGKPTEWEAVDMASGGASSLIVQFTAESDSTATSDTDITTVCEAMETGRTVVGYLSIGSASVLVGNPTEYQPPSMDSDGRIKFRFALMPTATSMQVIDLLLNNAGATINQYTIGGTA